jgi:hypothetical protein
VLLRKIKKLDTIPVKKLDTIPVDNNCDFKIRYQKKEISSNVNPHKMDLSYFPVFK